MKTESEEATFSVVSYLCTEVCTFNMLKELINENSVFKCSNQEPGVNMNEHEFCRRDVWYSS